MSLDTQLKQLPDSADLDLTPASENLGRGKRQGRKIRGMPPGLQVTILSS
jgi:hypothetical protein